MTEKTLMLWTFSPTACRRSCKRPKIIALRAEIERTNPMWLFVKR